MSRPYEKLSEEGTYWNIRVPVRYKTKARELAAKLGISAAEIARNGIEKEINFLEYDLLEETNRKVEEARSRNAGTGE